MVTTEQRNGQPTMTSLHPQDPKVRVYFEYISPDRAQALLRSNTRNRVVRRRYVLALADAMARDEFVVNGDTLRWSADGRLHDGQHRLHAIVESDCGQWMLVVEGLAVATAKTIDIGRKRTTGDIFEMFGHTQGAGGRQLAAACRSVWFYEQYGTLVNPMGSRMDATPSQLEDVMQRHPDLAKIARPASGALLRTAWAGAIHYLCALADDESADWFFDRLRDGVEIASGDPVYALRERLLRFNARGAARPDQSRQAKLVVRAWNATTAGERLQKIPMPTNPQRIAGCPIVPVVDREDG